MINQALGTSIRTVILCEFATGDTDDRVVPSHAKKLTATLQEAAKGKSTVLLRVEKKAGHGAGKPTSKLIDEWADFFGFLAKELDF